MNKTIKTIITAVLLLGAMLCLCACSDNWGAPYASLGQDGYNISIRFDANGGLFAGTKDVYIVDVYALENGMNVEGGKLGFPLLRPDDSRRKEGAFEVSRNGYFLAGWYTQRTARVDANGQALDDFGVPTSQSGRPQGYVYSGRWDFDRDMVQVDKNGSYKTEEPVQTLYAAWIPYINYEVYAVDPATGSTTLLSTVQTIDLEIPAWNEKTSKLDMQKFPKRDGMTLDSTYLDPGLTQVAEGTIYGQEAYVDFETGTVNVESVKLYTTWLEGEWFRIYTAQQLYANARLNGNYIICADLDFTDTTWSPTFVRGKFTGRIYGNGHTISNIDASQVDNSQIYGGLFGSMEAGAYISDLTLENVTFTVEAGSRMQGASFGLLTGSLSPEAVMENVTVTGRLLISENCYPQPDYTIGLLCGSGSTDGVEYTITCKAAEDNTDKITVEVSENGTVTVTFINP